MAAADWQIAHGWRRWDERPRHPPSGTLSRRAWRRRGSRAGLGYPNNGLDNSCLGTYNPSHQPPTAPMNAQRTATLEAPVASMPNHGVIRLINRVRVEVMDALDRELAGFDITAPQLV